MQCQNILGKPTKAVFIRAAALFFVSLCMTKIVFAQEHHSDNDKLSAILKSEIRSDGDRERDASRKPLETMAFFGIEEDMRVLELVPGGGWYTKILGPYLSNEGQLYLALGANPDRLKLSELGLDKVQIVGSGYEFNSTEQRGVFDLGQGDLGVENLDMVLTFRNIHNLSESSRAVLNKDVYDALKPGGIFGVIDHTRRHNMPDNPEIWRRVDPVQVIKEMIDAGFEFVDYSALHYQEEDQLILDSTHESIGKNSDRFTLKFRKPVN